MLTLISRRGILPSILLVFSRGFLVVLFRLVSFYGSPCCRRLERLSR